MVSEFKCNGWVQAGRRRVYGNWTMGTLTASSSALCISAPFFGRVVLSPQDVTELLKFSWVPVLWWGVTIRHLKPDVPPDLRFGSWISPAAVLSGILSSGFRLSGREAVSCLKCGDPMPDLNQKCTNCGWTYVEAQRNDA